MTTSGVNKFLSENFGFEIPGIGITTDDLVKAGASLKGSFYKSLEFFSPKVIKQNPTPALTYGSPAHSAGCYGSSFRFFVYVPKERVDLKGDVPYSSLETSTVHTATRITSLFLVLAGTMIIAVGVTTPPVAAPLFALLSAEKVVEVGLLCNALAVVLFGFSKLLIEDELFPKFSAPAMPRVVLTPTEKATTISYRDKLFSGYTREKLESPITRTNSDIHLYNDTQIETSLSHQVARIGGAALFAISSIGLAVLIGTGGSLALPISLLQAKQGMEALMALGLFIEALSFMTIEGEVVQAKKELFQIKGTTHGRIDLYSGLNNSDWAKTYIKKEDLQEAKERKEAYDYSEVHTGALFKTYEPLKKLKTDEHPLHGTGLLPVFKDTNK